MMRCLTNQTAQANNPFFSAVTAREKVFRAGIEGLPGRHREAERSGQASNDIKGERHSEGILDLLEQCSSGNDSSHVVRVEKGALVLDLISSVLLSS
jgi:hypothetical protein